RVQNHSYIGSGSPDDPFNLEVLRRLDLVIYRENTNPTGHPVVAVVAVGNDTRPIPALLAHGYNSIAVGRSHRNSSVGPTTGDVAGRSKPDIVAPLGVTSDTTPVVAAAAALLLQTADGKTDPVEAMHAGRVETIKAALLSGATKQPFAGLAQPWH